MIAADCIFCSRQGQPAPLFETPSLYVMPDKFPLAPGHVLVICKTHLPCYGAAAPALLAELDGVIAHLRQFLEETYSGGLLIWENGVSGQSVFHAHLHLIPAAGADPPTGLDDLADVWRIDGWQPVREHYARHGCYRYSEIGGERRLIAGHSQALAILRPYWRQKFGMRWGPKGWVKTTTPDDVLEVGRRWVRWVGGDEAKADWVRGSF